jgi:hypothetical protein
MISTTQPEPLMVTTSKLSGCTMGKPYNVHTMQLASVAKYGAGENCSTDPFFHISIKVGLQCISFQI